jgi:phage-related holin
MITKKLDIIVGFMGLSVTVFIFIALILMHAGERYLFFSGTLSSAFIFYIVFRY